MITEDGVLDRPLYFDIDGTLTESPVAHGIPILDRIQTVRKLINEGKLVVIWSGTGTAYAKDFVARHKLFGAVALGKPECCIDDNPTIRPAGRMKVIPPEEYFS